MILRKLKMTLSRKLFIFFHEFSRGTKRYCGKKIKKIRMVIKQEEKKEK